MTGLDNLQRILIESVGGFLRNVDRRLGVTCTVCATPIESGEFCSACRDHRRDWGERLADVVAPVAYGGQNPQSRVLLYGYKEPAAALQGDERRDQISLLVRVAYSLHSGCIERRVGAPITAWTVVPSTSQRPGHVLAGLAEQMLGAKGRGVTRAAAAQPADPRTVGRGRYVLEDACRLAGKHVVVIDDTWVTGGRAQSLALSLRENGASNVSVLVLARWLNVEWLPTRRYLAANPHSDFDPTSCPVTGKRCQ